MTFTNHHMPVEPQDRKSRYDVIVVGAGLGGLSAATRLAKSGLDVLILERHNLPGGYATSFVRGRFEFEVSLHELSGIGPPDKRMSLFDYLPDLGVAQRPRPHYPQGQSIHASVVPAVETRPVQ